MVFFGLDDDTVYRTMWHDRSFDQDFFAIFGNSYSDSSESDRFYDYIGKDLSFFHKYYQ